ncbi:SRPBCC family protein [Williamsia deligens]|uniref:SRPBCC family protein n=1 Tax=Williamsia deligens TaxID=321325 RepID=A0ABW3G4J3_9NOCA|nr:SRPBCC family protein [Williamsia deligens]MCP2194071.1 Carbon monoxide dehydrogenase subunit G [Williamsia deligens]
MPSVERTFSTTAPRSSVVEYLADFSHAEQWDPGTQRCTRNDDGPVRVGSSWHNESQIAGVSTELTYTLTELTDSRIVLVGRNETATSTETITVADVTQDGGAGSTVTYHNDVELSGAAKLASPVVKVLFEKLGNDTEKKLVEVLDALPAAHGG